MRLPASTEGRAGVAAISSRIHLGGGQISQLAADLIRGVEDSFALDDGTEAWSHTPDDTMSGWLDELLKGLLEVAVEAAAGNVELPLGDAVTAVGVEVGVFDGLAPELVLFGRVPQRSAGLLR